MVHYSAASASQTVREIQNYHMDTNGWEDIGYNFLVHSRTGEVFEGRGWLTIGAHCLNYNTPSIGVCVIGLDKPGVQDVSDAARASVKALYAEANRQAGRTLTRMGHRDKYATKCPGDELYAWVKAGMPVKGTPPSSPPPPPPTAQNWTDRLMKTLPELALGNGNRTAVLKMQALINTMGAGLVEDGVFGPKTLNAVKTWQARHRVPKSVKTDGTGDGIFGDACWIAALKV